MQLVTVVNRTQRLLHGMWDGRNHDLPIGKSALPLAIAEALKRQNPIMGSDNPTTGQLQYLVGIEEQGDELAPVEQSDEIELFNRHQSKDAIPIMIVQGNTGMYSVKRGEIATTLSGDSKFTEA